MPLYLRPPRKGKNANYEIRGSLHGVRVERTARTADHREAQKELKRIEGEIKRGEYSKPLVEKGPATFTTAALAYIKAGGEESYVLRIIKDTSEHALTLKPLAEIDQIAIDNAAHAVYPNAPATTLNRQFYTPVSAILKRAGIDRQISRPMGWRGSKSTSWLEPDQAFVVIREAYKIEPEFGAFCLMLLYTGMRLSDPLRAKVRDLRLAMKDKDGKPAPLLYVPDTKNGEPRPVHLPPIVVTALRQLPARTERPRKNAGKALANGVAGRSRASAGLPWLDRPADERLFRFHNGGRLRDMLALAIKRAGLSFPRRQGAFHLFCHTYGTWMHNYAGLDTYGLTRTGRWKDPDSADRYNHTMASPEAKRADLLPGATEMPGKMRGIGHQRKKA